MWRYRCVGVAAAVCRLPLSAFPGMFNFRISPWEWRGWPAGVAGLGGRPHRPVSSTARTSHRQPNRQELQTEARVSRTAEQLALALLLAAGEIASSCREGQRSTWCGRVPARAAAAGRATPWGRRSRSSSTSRASAAPATRPPSPRASRDPTATRSSTQP